VRRGDCDAFGDFEAWCIGVNDEGADSTAHCLDQIAGHAREGQKLRHAHLREWPDDLVHVAAGAEVTSGALHDDRSHGIHSGELAEQGPQLSP